MSGPQHFNRLAPAINRQQGSTSSGGGTPPAAAATSTGQVINLSISANTSIPLTLAGNNFYFIISTAPASSLIQARPRNGVWNQYQQGTGLDLAPHNGSFDQIEIWNKSANPVVVSIWIGFGAYIDKRLVVAGSQVQAITYATFQLNSGTFANIPDLSGTIVTDLNGNTFALINRLAIYISNYDLASTYTLSNTALTLGVCAIYPQTAIRFESAGNFKISNGASNLNATISETYNAIAPTFLLG